jgi:hypothetical protein
LEDDISESLDLLRFAFGAAVWAGAAHRTDRRRLRAIASTYLIPNRQRILYQCFEPRVFALRVPERREANITGPNSCRNFKQMRNGGNRCIDLADLRQNFCAIRFRDWPK